MSSLWVKSAYNLAEQIVQKYIEKGGMYIVVGEASGSGWEVRGTHLAIPEGTSIRVRKEMGHLATGAVLMDSVSS